MHYLWKKASVLQNQLKTTRQNGRIKKTTAQLIRVFEILIYQIKWLSSKEVDVVIKNNGARLWVFFVCFKFTVKCQTASIATAEAPIFSMLNDKLTEKCSQVRWSCLAKKKIFVARLSNCLYALPAQSCAASRTTVDCFNVWKKNKTSTALFKEVK